MHSLFENEDIEASSPMHRGDDSFNENLRKASMESQLNEIHHNPLQGKVVPHKQRKQYLLAREFKSELNLSKPLTLPPINSSNIANSSTQRDTYLQQQVDRETQDKEVNIFKTLPSDEAMLQSMHFGPIYDNEGKIISRSIVGKAEWFTRKERQTSSLNQMNLQSMGKSLGNSSMQIEDTLTEKSFQSQKQNTMNNSKYSQDNSISSMQAALELEKIKERIKKNQAQTKQRIENLDTNDRLEYTRDERILEQHTEVQLMWLQRITKSCSKLDRDPSMSLLVRSEAHRIRKEAIEIFDAVKTDFQKFGPRVWYMSLRKEIDKLQDQYEAGVPAQNKKDDFYGNSDFQTSRSPTMYPLVVLEDFPDAFRNAQVYQKNQNQIEIIRQPNLTDPLNSVLNNSMKSLRSGNFSHSSLSSQAPFASFKAEDYYLQRIKEIETLIQNSDTLFCNQETEIQGLAVIGKSQMEREEEMLSRFEPNLILKYKPESKNNIKNSNSIVKLAPKEKLKQDTHDYLGKQLIPIDNVEQTDEQDEEKQKQKKIKMQRQEEYETMISYDPKEIYKHGIYTSFPNKPHKFK